MSIKRPMCVLSLMFMLITYIALSLNGGVDESEYIADGNVVSITGKITDKVLKNGTHSLHIEVSHFSGSNLENISHLKKIIIYLDEQEISDFHIGQKVAVRGTFSNFAMAENEGQFDMRKYYRIRGYIGCLKKSKVEGEANGFDRFRNYLYSAREKTKGIYFENMATTEAGTLSAMVLGDKSDLDEDVKLLYQNAGISHILSLSGLHIATFGMCLFSLCMRLGFGEKGASFVSIVIIFCYGIMTGMSTSTVRAIIMFLLLLLAKNIGRTYDLLSAVYFSSILILLENPFLVYDSGFLMSFLSVVGIGMIYPVLIGCAEAKIKQSICISLSATLATMPVVMNSFFKISRYGIFINIIVVPLMSMILGIGILAGIIGNAFPKVVLFRRVTYGLLFVNERILGLYTFLSDEVARIHGNMWVTGKANTWQIVIYYCILASTCIGWEYYKKREVEDRGAKDSKGQCLVVAIFILAVGILSFRGYPKLSINSLSVGQGACNVMYGKNIPVVMIDGGSTDVKEVGKYRIEPFLLSNGIDSIDYLFITHPDTDHVSGVKELLSEKNCSIRIRHLFLSVYDKELIELAENKKVNIHFMRASDVVKNGTVNIRCLSPEDTVIDTSGNNEDLNDKSLVLRVEYADKNRVFSALYTGDISSTVENRLVATYGKMLSANYLSVPHHGSKYSSSEQFLASVKPTVATISAGKNNSYGHPHAETLERLEYASNARVLRTDESGQVSIIVGENVKVRQFKERNNDDK